MGLPSEKVDAIRQRADIVQIVGNYVDLKKRGRRHLGVCPFHAEKTPSFSVSADRGLYYCFGCHAGGDVFSFVMRHEGLDFTGAARKLAHLCGVELQPESPEIKRKRDEEAELIRVNEYARAFFCHSLWSGAGIQGREYLSKRGIPEEMAKKWELGFGGRPAELLNYLAAKRVPRDLAQRAGFLTDDGSRGLFDGRVVFPISDSAKRLVGFGGRRLGEFGPKYINTRESVLFTKRRLLFGWDRAEGAIRRTKRAVLVEGFMDVLACHRAGIEMAVAALGTAFTEDHAKSISRLADDVVLLFDGDAAGLGACRGATLRLLERRGNGGKAVKVLVSALPAGEDPDSIVISEGSVGLQRLVNEAKPAVAYFIECAFDVSSKDSSGSGSSMTIEDRAQAAMGLAPMLHALGSGLEQDLYLARLADKVGVSVDHLQAHLTRARQEQHVLSGVRTSPRSSQKHNGSQRSGDLGKPVSGHQPQPVVREPAPGRVELEWLCQLLLYPFLRSRWGELAEFASEPMRPLLLALASTDQPASEIVTHHVKNSAWQRRIAAIEPAEDPESGDTKRYAEKTFCDVLRRFKGRHVEELLATKRRELREREARGDLDIDDLFRQIQNLTRRKRELKRPLTV